MSTDQMTTLTAPPAPLIPDWVPQWQHHFPSSELVGVGAGMIPTQPCGELTEGPRWKVIVSPGAVKLRCVDETKAERTAERTEQGVRKSADMAASYLADGDEVPEATPRQVIADWSRASRNRMVYAFCALDYTPMMSLSEDGRLPAMLTLTYPQCWLTVAPSGRAVKKHLKKFRKRYERAFHETCYAVWKMEFQRRLFGDKDTSCHCVNCDGLDDGRAPHIHMLIVPPRVQIDGMNFNEWVSQTWAECVNHPDPEQFRRHVSAGTSVSLSEGLRSSDPKRVAVYFTKHGSFSAKEYQNCVPKAWQEPTMGPGRFWGYWGLEKGEVTVAVSDMIGHLLGRTLRRYSKASGRTEMTRNVSNGVATEKRIKTTREVQRPRCWQGRAESRYPEVIGLAGKMLMQAHAPKYRTTRIPAVRCKNGRGWLSVNDGASMAADLGMYLRGCLDNRDAAWLRREQERQGVADDPAYRARRLIDRLERDQARGKNVAAQLVKARALLATLASTQRQPVRSVEVRQVRPVVGPVARGAALTCSRCGDPLAEILAERGTHVGCARVRTT